jgi:hypothetical protein
MRPLIKEIRPYTKGELSAFYGVCVKTFSKWLRPFQDKIGERNGHFYSVEQVKIIFSLLGIPESYEDAA